MRPMTCKSDVYVVDDAFVWEATINWQGRTHHAAGTATTARACYQAIRAECERIAGESIDDETLYLRVVRDDPG